MYNKAQKTTTFVKAMLIFFIVVAFLFGSQFLFYPIADIDLEFTASQVVAQTITSRYNLENKLSSIRIIKRYRNDDSYIFIADDGTNHYLASYKRHLFLPIFSIYSVFRVENYPFIFSMKNGLKSYRVQVSLEGIKLI